MRPLHSHIRLCRAERSHLRCGERTTAGCTSPYRIADCSNQTLARESLRLESDDRNPLAYSVLNSGR
jgi:hypothetical protein